MKRARDFFFFLDALILFGNSAPQVIFASSLGEAIDFCHCHAPVLAVSVRNV